MRRDSFLHGSRRLPPVSLSGVLVACALALWAAAPVFAQNPGVTENALSRIFGTQSGLPASSRGDGKTQLAFDDGPGGPILVVTSAANPFGRYYGEILRAEGFTGFELKDVGLVTPAILAAHDVVILGEMALNAAQVTMLADWVNNGGNLIAMRPDPQLAGLLGLTPAGGTLSDKYLLVNTASGPGVGIVSQTIQFHSAADLYTLNGATAVATLYSDPTTGLPNPAVTMRSVGSNGGDAVAFTYDLARSVVYTRQGNPAWNGQERDGIIPIRSDDLFFGNLAGDEQPDWIDLDKVAVPQADEQQRLLANLIIKTNLDRKPLPHFWYFPKGRKAVVIMTGDDHGDAGMIPRFKRYMEQQPADPDTLTDDWLKVRASGYLYLGSSFDNNDAIAYTNLGFEVGYHINTDCLDWTPTSLADTYDANLTNFANAFPGIPGQSSSRTHCIAWSDWATQAEIEAQHGIRLDCNYYYWPPSWLQNRPGMFTGSGMPMRFARLNGSLIDCYQAATQIPDESDLVLPNAIDQLLDKALGPEGYYGAFTMNMHFDTYPIHAGSEAVVASALSRQVPVISGRQMLTWLDGRNNSTCDIVAWTGTSLQFNVTVAPGAQHLRGMLPTQSSAGALSSITRNLVPLTYTTATIKGIEYAFFPAEAGSYVANYVVDNTPPVISGVTATPHGDGTATIAWSTDEPSDSRVDWGATPSLGTPASNAALTTSHSVVISGLLESTSYYYRVSSTDGAANTATEPAPPAPPLSFTNPPLTCFVDVTDAAIGFGGGSNGGTYVSRLDDGEVILAPTEASEFSGTALPAGWFEASWVEPPGSPLPVVVGGGTVTIDAARVGTNNVYGPGRVLEFRAQFSGDGFEHVGFGLDYNDVPWAIFSTHAGGVMEARTNISGSFETPITIPPGWFGSPHDFRIEWGATDVKYYIDGDLKAAHPASGGSMRPLASDLTPGGGVVTVDWMHLSPYVGSGSGSGTFTSRVFDGLGPNNWGTATWTADTPTGTALAVSVRRGDTATPDGSWTSWIPVGTNGGAVGGSSRYIQYQVEMSRPALSPDLTVVLRDVTITCNAAAPDLTPPVISNVQATPGPDGTTATVTWTTDENANSLVEYGTSPGSLTLSASSSALVLSHSLGLTGLTPGATYYYRVTSADVSNNSATSPQLADPPLSFTTPSDIAPPVISNVQAAPGANGTTATVTWTTDESASSLVEYGTSPGSLTLNASSPALVLSHSVGLIGLAPGATYYYRVTSADAANNSATSPQLADPPLSFTTPVLPCAVSTTAADFNSGTLDAGTYVAETGDGEIILKPTAGAEFSGALDSGWADLPWPGGAASTFSNGRIVVDGSKVVTEPTSGFNPGHSLEFMASYAATNFIHVGFAGGNDDPNTGMFNNWPWALFSIGSLSTPPLARTWNGGGFLDQPAPDAALNTMQHYRIDWKTNSVDYYIYVGGVPVLQRSEPVAIIGPMRPGISDYTANGLALTVDWVRMLPYALQGTYTSKVFDGGGPSSWGAMTWNATTPTPTAIALSVRKGNSPTPDESWSEFVPVATSGTVVGGISRYIQYQAVLTTSDPDVTPELRDVNIECTGVPTATAAAVVASGTCISNATPCVSVPVVLTRNESINVRAISVTVQLGPEVRLCTPATPASSIHQGSWLSGFSSTFQVIDRGAGVYQVDQAILGTSCGVTTGGQLFTLDVTNTGADGTGTIAVTQGSMRDCANASLPVQGGSGSLTVDRTPPTVVSDLLAQRATTGNDNDGTTKINVSFTAPGGGTTVEVYRAPFGNYPEYDDPPGAGSEPAQPTSYPLGTPWTLVPGMTASGQDDPPSRDFWYYVVVTKDACGNAAISTRTDGALNYHLGDVHDGLTACAGNNLVNLADISFLGLHYGVSVSPTDAWSCLDVGPTTDLSVNSRPTTDNIIEFEDLVLFGINFGLVAGPPARALQVPTATNELRLVVPPLPGAGETFSVSLEAEGAGSIQGLSVMLDYDHAVVEPVGVERGELLNQQGAESVVLSSKPGNVDVALLGRGRGLTGKGVVAKAVFRVKAPGAAGIRLGKVEARDAGNQAVALGQSPATPSVFLPTRTALGVIYPNPFSGTTSIQMDLRQETRVSLMVYDIAGRRVRTLVSGVEPAGRRLVSWDGRGDDGVALPSGQYILRLEAGGVRMSRHVQVIR